jgi:hypothetical protein
MLTIALIDETGGHVDPGDIAKMVTGMQSQTPAFCKAWSLDGITVQEVADAQSVPQGAAPFLVTWGDPSVPPGALGWHDEQMGTSYAEIPADVVTSNGGGVLDGGAAGVSVLSVALHELWELAIDRPVDDWVLMPSGIFLAKETADPVQMVPVAFALPDGTSCLGSDWVTPSYFDAQAATDGTVSFDGQGALVAPFTMAPGGYQIQFDPSKLSDPNGPIVQVFGAKMPGWLRDMKARRPARARRRRDRAWGRLARVLGRTLTEGGPWVTS